MLLVTVLLMTVLLIVLHLRFDPVGSGCQGGGLEPAREERNGP
ncbi:hypothetical protein BH24DEI1_BH24DEI1_20230 [soil metagenome]